MVIVIKDQKVRRLLDSIVEMTGESETEAIRRALIERMEHLASPRVVSQGVVRLEMFLQDEIWSNIPESLLGTSLTKAEEETILGYGEQ